MYAALVLVVAVPIGVPALLLRLMLHAQRKHLRAHTVDLLDGGGGGVTSDTLEYHHMIFKIQW